MIDVGPGACYASSATTAILARKASVTAMPLFRLYIPRLKAREVFPSTFEGTHVEVENPNGYHVCESAEELIAHAKKHGLRAPVVEQISPTE